MRKRLLCQLLVQVSFHISKLRLQTAEVISYLRELCNQGRASFAMQTDHKSQLLREGDLLLGEIGFGLMGLRLFALQHG